MARTLDVLRHGHVNQFCSDYDALLDFYRETFDAPVFSEFSTPQFGARNALYVAGAACFEAFSPTDVEQAIGAWITRFGERWHSLEWTVPSLEEAIEIVEERGIRITDHVPDSYIFVHPRDCHGLSLELTTHFFEHDPRGETGWDPAIGAGTNPIGITGGPTVTLCVPDAAESIAWMCDLTGRTQAGDHVGTAAVSAAIDFGDHVVEFVSPTDAPEDADLAQALASRGSAIYAVTLPVRSLDVAERELAARGVRTAAAGWDGCRLLAIDQAQSGGALLRLRDRVHP